MPSKTQSSKTSMILALCVCEQMKEKLRDKLARRRWVSIEHQDNDAFQLSISTLSIGKMEIASINTWKKY